MTKKNLTIIGVVFVIFTALFFRFWKLSDYPVSLSMDEVSIGYNAYSLLKTGRDEWGEKLPLAFKSVGDYKPPVNVYLTVPSIALFGLNEFAVRFPTALLGLLTVVVCMLLLKELSLSRAGIIFGGIWIAISPWHVHFSRQSFEAITALFLFLCGFLAFLHWLRKRQNLLLILSVILFSLSVWSYHAERLFVPFFVLFLVWLNRDALWKLKEKPRSIILVLAVLAVLAIPFINLSLTSEAIRNRAASTSILREQSLLLALNKGIYSSTDKLIFDNDIYLIFRHWVGKYLNYYDLRFWFWKGMSFTPPGHFDLGLLHFADLLLIPLGIYALIRSKNKNLKKIVLFLFFIGPFPASLTMNEQHALRALTWLPFFGIVGALGFENALKNKKLTILYSGVLLLGNIYFIDIYFRHYPRFFSEYIGYGFKEISEYACANRNKYDRIIITDTFGSEGPLNTGIPYIYILFYCQIDPDKFVKNNRTIDKFTFRRINWQYDPSFKQMKNALLVGSVWDFTKDQVPENQIIKEISFLNGKPAFLLVRTDEESEDF